MKKKISLSDMPVIDIYKEMRRLKLGKERMKKVKYSLQVEEMSRRGFENRKKYNDLYFNYPAQKDKSTVTKSHQVSQKQQVTITSHKQILDALKALKDKHILNQLKQRIERAQQRVALHHPQLKIENLRKDDVSISKSQNDPINLQKVLVDIAETNKFSDLEKIVQLRDDKYFFNNLLNRQLNIFTFLVNPKDKQFYSGWEKLNNLNFHFDLTPGMMNKKFNEQIIKELSSYRRIAAVNASSKSVPQDFRVANTDEFVDENHLQVNNLLLLVDGLGQKRKLPLFSQNLDERQLADITNKPVMLDKKGEKGVIWNGGDFKTAEIQIYKDNPLDEEEKKVVSQQKAYFKKLNTIHEKEITSKQFMIQDQKELKSFIKDKSSFFQKQLNNFMDWKKEQKRSISGVDIKKNKSEHMKINLLVKCFKEKRAIEKKVYQKSSKKRVSSFSPGKISK